MSANLQNNAVWRKTTVTLLKMVLITLILASGSALANDPTGLCKILSAVQTALNGISIGVVTIAIIFAGYQVAFAHKRITEVAPLLIGAVLIGAASQIASMIINANTTQQNCVTAMLNHLLPYYV